MDTPQTPIAGTTPEPAAKPWWTSRTLWFNAIVGAMAVLDANTGALMKIFPPDIYQIVVLLIAVINGALRMSTAAAIRK